jgi:hypothetical protein
VNHKQLLIDTYRQQGGLVPAHFGDFTDAEMLIRPFPNANHAAWTLGHLVTTTANLSNLMCPGAFPSPSQDDTKRYSGEGARLDDGFPGKDELLQRFADMNDCAIKWVECLTDAQMDKPMPEQIQAFAPTVGHLAYVLPAHVMMHLGQVQVIRRKLGKPVLF